jgi:NMD protein affecting ribosome stability and mRNA decay
MINSGRASLIASGSYNKVYKAAYKMLPGDIVAYEKKGKITHISVVTGADSKGYTLVNCHNTDRYHVPWDLGWSDKGIKFYLIRVHF